MARIVTVFTAERRPFVPVDMSYIRWLKISEALARLDHEVDIAADEPGLRARLPIRLGGGLRRVPLARVRWDRYDVVKTLFHMGFETLEQRGGDRHPFVIAKLGSLVADRDREGVYFYGDERRRLFETQTRIAARARWVALLTDPSRALWRACYGDDGRDLLVPGAVDATLPPAGPSPYERPARVCVFAGNVYDGWYQAAVHRTLVAKIDALGRGLRARGMELHVLGHGDHSRFDREVVTAYGPVPYERSWDYLRHAAVGVVLAFRPEPNHNESTKIYHYLRAGLPTVCEAGFPNQGLVEQAHLGTVVRNGDMEGMAETVVRCAQSSWDRDGAVRYVLEHHTWDARARIYHRLIT